jgi:hypothetical protein
MSTIASPVALLTRQLEARGVRYCHWKSNEHLAEAADGRTDLDILVDRQCRDGMRLALAESGFRPMWATPWAGYPAVEDHVAIDPVLGRLVHCHLHYRLILGERHLKGYRLPWEEEILASRELAGETGLFRSQADWEMLLLVVRMGLKIRARDWLGPLRRRTWPAKGERAEFEWLRSRITPDLVLEHCLRAIGPQAAERLGPVLRDGPTLRNVAAFAKAARRRLREFRRYGATRAAAGYYGRLCLSIVARIRKRRGTSVPYHRTIASGGVVVAFVGADGSGKSTVTREVRRCFAEKIDVLPVYFGSGDGTAMPMRGLLRRAKSLVRKSPSSRSASPGFDGAAAAAGAGGIGSGFGALYRVCWALLLAHEKSVKLREAWRASSNGLLVIADRYPQAEVMGSTDGPLLAEWRDHPSRLRRAVARWEARPYEWARAQPPDLVIRLRVSGEAAFARKPEYDLSWSTKRVAIIDSLTFGGACVVDIDAEQPLPEVLSDAYRRVWERV